MSILNCMLGGDTEDSILNEDKQKNYCRIKDQNGGSVRKKEKLIGRRKRNHGYFKVLRNAEAELKNGKSQQKWIIVWANYNCSEYGVFSNRSGE